MNNYAIYNLITGNFTGIILECGEEHLLQNIPEECSCLLGVYDNLSQCVDLKTGEVVDYIPEQPSPNHVWDVVSKRWLYVKTDEDIAQEVRTKRDSLLAQSDWVVTKAFETEQPVPTCWKEYRKALRDVSEQKGFPRNVVWPAKPE